MEDINAFHVKEVDNLMKRPGIVHAEKDLGYILDRINVNTVILICIYNINLFIGILYNELNIFYLNSR